MHESRFDPKITSPRGARGLWQLMPGLAAHFELAVPENWRGLPPSADPRTRPAEATRVGVKYLKKLFGQYQDPFLAMAAYNSGEPQLNSALRRLKAAPEVSADTVAVNEAARVDEALSHVTDARFRSDYWYLQRMNLLPAETIQYVPKIVATMVAAEELGG
jgi:soluble lytic murein transglycosylase-like protein